MFSLFSCIPPNARLSIKNILLFQHVSTSVMNVDYVIPACIVISMKLTNSHRNPFCTVVVNIFFGYHRWKCPHVWSVACSNKQMTSKGEKILSRFYTFLTMDSWHLTVRTQWG